MQAIGWVVFGTAMMFVVLHRDPDPTIERLRRRRLRLVIPASLLTIGGIVLIVFAPR